MNIKKRLKIKEYSKTEEHLRIGKNLKIKKHLRIPNQSVMTNWFLSYLIILALAICFSIGIYFYSFHIINEQSRKINKTLIEKLKVEVDGHIGEINTLLENLLLDQEVQKITGIKNKVSLKDQELIYSLKKNLSAKYISIQGLDDIYIFLNNTNTVLSINGHMSGEQFFSLYYKNENSSYEEFLELMQQPWSWKIISVNNSKNQSELLFVQTSLAIGSGDHSATIVISIKEERLMQWLSETKWDESMKVFIMDSENHIFGLNENEKFYPEFTYESLNTKSSIVVENKTYMLSSVNSKETEWSYIALIPISIMEINARKIQLFTLIGLLFCVTFGILLSYFMTRAHYHPLKGVMNLFENQYHGAAKKVKNEYQWLTEQATNFFKEQRNDKKILRKHFLYRLITRPYVEKAQENKIEHYEISLPEPWNVVVLFLCTGQQTEKEDSQSEAELSKFIASNIFEEVVAEYFNIESVEIGEVTGFVVNLSENSQELREQLETVIDCVQKWISSRFHFKITAFLGEIKQGIDGIHGSYLTANEAYEYRTLLDEQEIIWYDDIKNRQIIYEYPLEIEQKIINAIKVGEAKSANQWISEVLIKNYNNKKAAKSMRACLLYDLVGTVMKGADSGGAKEFIETLDLEQSFSIHLPVQQLEKNFHQIIEIICENIRKKELKNRNDKQFGKKVMEYVDKNFENPDLNISITAMNFDITPTYLSALFKEQTGISLLEYINKARIEKAKELLNQGYSVTEVSAKTGFRNSGALIRVFKKMTGVTPGQMKKL